MRKVDGTELVDLILEYPFPGEVEEETATLLELGWKGEQGEALEKFMDDAYKQWAWEYLEGSISFSEKNPE